MSNRIEQPDLRAMSTVLAQVQTTRTLEEIAHASHVLAEHLADLANAVDAEHQTALDMAVIAAERIEAMATAET